MKIQLRQLSFYIALVVALLSVTVFQGCTSGVGSRLSRRAILAADILPEIDKHYMGVPWKCSIKDFVAMVPNARQGTGAYVNVIYSLKRNGGNPSIIMFSFNDGLCGITEWYGSPSVDSEAFRMLLYRIWGHEKVRQEAEGRWLVNDRIRVQVTTDRVSYALAES